MAGNFPAAKKASLTFPERKGEFYLLLPIGFLYNASFGMITVLVPLYANLLGAREAIIGLIMAVPGVLQVFLRAPSGRLSSFWGARRMFLLSFSCVVIISAFYLILPGYGWFFLPQLFLGIASATFWPSQWSFASELAPKERRSAVLGYTSASVGFGAFFGPYAGGYLFDRFGPKAFLFYALIGLAGLLLVSQLPSEKKQLKLPKLSLFFQDTLADSRQLLGILPVFYAVSCMLMAALTKGVNNAFYALYVRSLGLTATLGGVLLALHGGLSCFARLLFGRFANTRHLYYYLFGGTFLNAAGMILMPFFPHPYLMALVTFLSGMGFGFMYPAAVALIADCTEGSDRTLGMGLFGTAMCLGQLTSPLFLGPVAQFFGLARAFQIGNCFSILGTVFLYLHSFRRGFTRHGHRP